MAVANIGKKDFGWTLAAIIFKIGSGVFLFPIILRFLPTETIGVWSIFTVICQLSFLLDFGFNASFARNIAYVFSGVKNLKKNGYEKVNTDNSIVDFGLLSSTIRAMRFFYSRISIIIFVLLLTLGSLYVFYFTKDYEGNLFEIYISWFILIIINSYNVYTIYYESLMNGRGLIKELNKYVLFGNIAYIILAIILIFCGFGLIAIVSSQVVSVVIIRLCCKKAFYTNEIKEGLKEADDKKYKEVLDAIYPNAIKVGLTSLGGFVINKSSMFIGSLFVSLELMASYGITLQLLTVVGMVANIFTRVYMPKVFQWRVEGKLKEVKRMFYLSSIVLLGVFMISAFIIVGWGNWILSLLKSQTFLIPTGLLILMFIQYCLEYNHANAAQYLLSKNEVPFFKASLISAAATLVLLIVFVVWLKMGLIGMILAPTLAQAAYQNWKWPLAVIKEFRNI